MQKFKAIDFDNMGRKRVYTDEELKERRRQRCRQYNQEHKAELAKKKKQWYQEHPEYNKQYYQANRERFKEQRKQYYQDNAERYKEYSKENQKQYYNTPIGRAHKLVKAYNREDKKYNRGEGDLTAEWIVENIFPKPCAHCGKEGWKVIGCNRLDNNKPHSKDNVEPCCFKCNSTLPRKIKES